MRLHPILHAGFRAAGFGVFPEQRLPNFRSRPRRSEGERCDIALTPAPAEGLTDPLLETTLFAGRGVDPREALWIEVKAAGQFAVIDGVGRPNSSYTSQLLTGAVADVRKLAKEGELSHTAALIVMFNADEAAADHDLRAWAHRCLDKGLPISSPSANRFPITDRIGNTVCTVALTRVGHV